MSMRTGRTLDRTKSTDGDERKRTMGVDGGENGRQVEEHDMGVLSVSEQTRGRTVTPSSPAGRQTNEEEGERMIMRMIWSFWEGLEAKVDVCHYVRLMHVSTSSHFPLLAWSERRLGDRRGRGEPWADVLEGSGACLCWCPT